MDSRYNYITRYYLEQRPAGGLIAGKTQTYSSPTQGNNSSPTQGNNSSPTQGNNSPTQGNNSSPTQGKQKKGEKNMNINYAVTNDRNGVELCFDGKPNHTASTERKIEEGKKMKRYNQQQENYLLALANLELLSGIENEIDRKYIAENNIINPDGTIPCATYAIEDDVIANKAMDDIAKIMVDSGIWGEILEARKQLKDAENALIQYGLRLAPKHEREVLTKAAETNYSVRRKIIDLVMKLDTSTVKTETAS